MFGLPFMIEYYSHIKFVWPMRRWSGHFVTLMIARILEIVSSSAITFIGIFGLFGIINMDDGVLNVIPEGINNNTILTTSCIVIILSSLFDLAYEPSAREKSSYDFVKENRKAA